MSLIDRTIYQCVNNNISTQVIEKNFSPTKNEIEFVANNTIKQTYLCFLITLKFFQYTGYFIKVAECPSRIRNHIANCMKVKPLIEDHMHAYDMSRQARRHQEIILEHLKIKPYDKQIVIKIAKDIAKTKDVQVDLINCIIEELLRQDYELPTFDTLETIAQSARNTVNTEYYKIIHNNLTKKQINTITKKILINDPDGKNPWNVLKDEPEKPTIKTLKKFVQHYIWLKSIDIDNNKFNGVPSIKIDRFFQEANTLDLYRIRRLRKEKKIALVAVTIRKVTARAIDDLCNILIKIMQEIENLAKQKLLLYKAEQFGATDELVHSYKDVLVAYKNGASKTKKINAIADLIGENVEYLLEKCDEYDAHTKKDHLPFMLQRYEHLRKDLLSCLEQLNLCSATEDKDIERIIKLVLKHANSNLDTITVKDFGKCKLALTWFPPKWRKFIMQDKNNILKKKLELFVFFKIAAQLKTKDLIVNGSEHYIDYTTSLIGWNDYNKNIAEYGKITNKSTEPDTFVMQLIKELRDACEDADLAFNGKINATIKNGKVKLEKIVAEPLPKNFKRIKKLIEKKLKKVTILDVIVHITKSLHLEVFIQPISGHETKLADPLEHISTTLFCYACNVGASETSKSLGNISRKQIGWINTSYILEEILDNCNLHVVDYYHKFRLPKSWGTGEHMSVDGTLLEMYQKNIMAKFSARHKQTGAMGYYHISDTYIALFSTFISCGAYEALYLIEGILKNKSKIQPKYVHGDTHSQTLAIFALMYLLGIKLMPRIKGIKKLIFYKARKEDKYININDLLKEVIDWELIQTHTKEMFRIALSIKDGTINPSIIIDRICSKGPKNQIYYALTELGKVVRTCYLLEYICDFDLRKVVHAATCKSEEFNEYRDWVAFGGNVIKENDRIKQRKFIKYNHLVTNMLSLYNVQEMSAVIGELRQQGHKIPEEIIQRLNPYRKKNISRLGAFDLNIERIQKELRPIDCDIDIEE